MKDNIALILGILGLILAWFLCLGAPATTVAPVAVAPPPAVVAPPPIVVAAPTPASARMNVLADRKVVLEGTVRDDAIKGNIVTQANALYGAPNVTDNLKIDGQVAELKSIVITGEVASDQVKTTTGDNVKKAVGADVAVDNQLRVAAPVARNQGEQIKALLTGRTIEFFTGSAIITPVGQKILNELVPVLDQDKTTRVEIQGHTDNVGDPTSNQRLSEARAASTLQYLVARGVDAARLTPKGYGQDKPIAGNETVEGRQHNRRISFQVESK